MAHAMKCPGRLCRIASVGISVAVPPLAVIVPCELATAAIHDLGKRVEQPAAFYLAEVLLNYVPFLCFAVHCARVPQGVRIPPLSQLVATAAGAIVTTLMWSLFAYSAYSYWAHFHGHGGADIGGGCFVSMTPVCTGLVMWGMAKRSRRSILLPSDSSR